MDWGGVVEKVVWGEVDLWFKGDGVGVVELGFEDDLLLGRMGGEGVGGDGDEGVGCVCREIFGVVVVKVWEEFKM